jgi:transposase-like protein
MNRLTPPATTAAPDTAAPAFCPACGSGNVQTTSKTVDSSSYWRCRQCGEVWNVLRREAARGFRRFR